MHKVKIKREDDDEIPDGIYVAGRYCGGEVSLADGCAYYTYIAEYRDNGKKRQRTLEFIISKDGKVTLKDDAYGYCWVMGAWSVDEYKHLDMRIRNAIIIAEMYIEKLKRMK